MRKFKGMPEAVMHQSECIEQAIDGGQLCFSRIYYDDFEDVVHVTETAEDLGEAVIHEGTGRWLRY